MALKFGPGTVLRKSAICIAVVAPICFEIGCCQKKTTDGPRYYKRELAAMKRAKIRAEKENLPSIKNGYPWDKKRTSDCFCLPYSIKNSERHIQKELDCLHEFIHGKKKIRVEFRD